MRARPSHLFTAMLGGLLAALTVLACGTQLPTTGDALVPVARRGGPGLAEGHVAGGGGEDDERGVALAIVYSTNNDGEIEPCG